MSTRHIVLIVVLAALTVLGTEAGIDFFVRRLAPPAIVLPPEKARLTPPVVVAWTGSPQAEIVLQRGGARFPLGTRGSPVVLPRDVFPSPGRYGIEVRARRLGRWVAAQRVFSVDFPGREKEVHGRATREPRGEPIARADPELLSDLVESLNGLYAAYQSLQGEKQGLERQLEELRAEADRMAADLETEREECEQLRLGLATVERQNAECSQERDRALEEVAALRRRLEAEPACLAWGYLSFPPTGTTPPRRRLFVINDPRGRLFAEPAACERTRAADPTARTSCGCVIGAPATMPGAAPTSR